jgi:hypothetical protein
MMVRPSLCGCMTCCSPVGRRNLPLSDPAPGWAADLSGDRPPGLRRPPRDALVFFFNAGQRVDHNSPQRCEADAYAVVGVGLPAVRRHRRRQRPVEGWRRRERMPLSVATLKPPDVWSILHWAGGAPAAPYDGRAQRQAHARERQTGAGQATPGKRDPCPPRSHHTAHRRARGRRSAGPRAGTRLQGRAGEALGAVVHLLGHRTEGRPPRPSPWR